ncbi:hypothetical protein NC653_002702 [Populus alba x Populus x berolinensis]|uniref:Uncharacterized protein n=1 Tax=Populus alba x Populus x berolinensis TaxID=444605 RepID=A0AAD6RPG1_9ROSI|nr:hypothetical protein NC653_002702 [Populus alba x Populus x berolinensis]
MENRWMKNYNGFSTSQLNENFNVYEPGSSFKSLLRAMAIHRIDIFPESKISALLSGNDSSSVSSCRKNPGVSRTTRRWMPLHENIGLGLG